MKRKLSPKQIENMKYLKRTAGPGRPKLTEQERAAREASRQEIAELWPQVKEMTLAELEESLKNPRKIPVVKLAMMRAAANAIKHGELTEFHRFYDRLLGKPKSTVDVETGGEPIRFNFGF